MSADEIFILVLVIGSMVAVVAMAVHSRRAKTSSRAPAAEDHRRAEAPASPPVSTAPGRTTRDRQKR
jgi:hypothetical protein